MTNLEQFDYYLTQLSHILGEILFFDLLGFMHTGDTKLLPLTVCWLVLGSIVFTLYFRVLTPGNFIHAIKIVMGKYDNKESVGEVTHFQALATALSATVGLGNIAGVSIALGVGGPGATLWMIVAGFLGMTTKFVECSLAQKYRTELSNGEIRGGPMEYLSKGLKEKGFPRLGKIMGALFAVFCICGSLGGGNAFQSNQSAVILTGLVPELSAYRHIIGMVIAGAVGIVIIGGVKRIARVAEVLVPFMCGFYLLASFWILGANFSSLGGVIEKIISSAFSFEAGLGGFLGVVVTGFRRAAFSNEAGLGSASIAHASAKSEHPIMEGMVAMLEPFIDTVVICTITALVVVTTGVLDDPNNTQIIKDGQGAALAAKAFGSQVAWFPYVLAVAVVMFAYSTMISWSYYGERCWNYLFNEKGTIVYKVIFLMATFSGTVVSADNVIELSDYAIFVMGFVNILGILFLIRTFREDLVSYTAKYIKR